MTPEHEEAVRLAEKHGARVALVPEPFPNAIVFGGPHELAALIAEVRREERERCAQECDDLGQSDGVTCAKELRIGMPATHQYHCANSSCSGPEWFGAAKQSQTGTYIDCPRCGHPADVEPIRARLDSPSGKEERK